MLLFIVDTCNTQFNLLCIQTFLLISVSITTFVTYTLICLRNIADHDAGELIENIYRSHAI